MKISVIMAALNCEATIGQAIDSFLQQDHPDKELLIIDGVSSDRTLEIARAYEAPEIRVVSEPDEGIYDAMNSGLRRMRGDAFGCLNADDRYAMPNSLSLIAEALGKSDLVSGGLRFFRGTSNETVRIWHPEPFRKGHFGVGYSLPHPSTYARREVYEAIGDFATDYLSAGDYEWFVRALELNDFTHSVFDPVLVEMRVGGQSTDGMKAWVRNSKEMLAIRQKHLGSGRIDRALFLNLARKFQQVRQARKTPQIS